jgi:hypothetical protein
MRESWSAERTDEDVAAGHDGRRKDGRHRGDADRVRQEGERHDDHADDERPGKDVGRPEALKDKGDLAED